MTPQTLREQIEEIIRRNVSWYEDDGCISNEDKVVNKIFNVLCLWIKSYEKDYVKEFPEDIMDYEPAYVEGNNNLIQTLIDEIGGGK